MWEQRFNDEPTLGRGILNKAGAVHEDFLFCHSDFFLFLFFSSLVLKAIIMFIGLKNKVGLQINSIVERTVVLGLCLCLFLSFINEFMAASAVFTPVHTPTHDHFILSDYKDCVCCIFSLLLVRLK